MTDKPISETKTCPTCAEEVKTAAKVCRFCGYDFELGKMPMEKITTPSVTTKSSKSGSSVGDGVRIGCGMFIVLPIIIVVAIVIFFAIASSLGSH